MAWGHLPAGRQVGGPFLVPSARAREIQGDDEANGRYWLAWGVGASEDLSWSHPHGPPYRID
jgi:hypothetical protein